MTGQTEPTDSWSWMEILREHPEFADKCQRGNDFSGDRLGCFFIFAFNYIKFFCFFYDLILFLVCIDSGRRYISP